MSVFVDTSVWSLALRRDAPKPSPQVGALKDALEGGEPVVTTGLVLQELLQGFSGPRDRVQIIDRFGALPILSPGRQDHIDAALEELNALAPSTATLTEMVQAMFQHVVFGAFDDPENPALKRGIEYLSRTQNADGSWTEHETTGTGFPKVFYLKYDMYRNAWPLLALATYRKILNRAQKTPASDLVNGAINGHDFHPAVSAVK